MSEGRNERGKNQGRGGQCRGRGYARGKVTIYIPLIIKDYVLP